VDIFFGFFDFVHKIIYPLFVFGENMKNKPLGLTFADARERFKVFK
jgi:hypothetical protein